MRLPRSSILPVLGLGIALAASGCSRAGTAENSVDVAAAASRAQSDIANYAAGPERHDAAPTPSATATRGPTGMPMAAPISDDATPAHVVQRYTDALAARRYAEAWALWDENGKASGMTEAAFAGSFGKYATYKATIGTPFDEDAGAGQRYITVPVVVTGTLASGGPFRLEGSVILHKAADGIESDDPHAHAWRIRSSEMKPRPATSVTAGR
ncbi:hypothetical protein FHT00_000288 [Sphingomonas insulae]|uniref:Lipoprotein n=1 Tax=Sphingomonas insulae TaxID=424800 RepID=A0ABP3SXG7_9SPHN|nr:hypothetical protein [Sphingomonas insulae]NIJ28360.1 hypothetical protein [Sphingomonas insulae]